MTAMQAGGAPGGNIRCDQLVELVTDYLEGVLDEATMTEFDAHLTLCSGCAEYLDQIRSVARNLGELPLDPLSASARARLLAAFERMGH
jgi:anti-sigma factor RsiW